MVRENESGKLGTFEQPLVLPEISKTGLLVSSVVLSNELKQMAETQRGRARKGKEEIPLQVGDRSVLPSVTRVFRTNQTLAIYLESYAGKQKTPPSGTPAAQVGPSVAVVFFRNGRKTAEAGPFPGKLEKAGGEKAIYFVQIPLSKFPAGRYLLQVNVLDPAANSVAFARIPLAVVPPPRRPVVTGKGG